MYTTETTEIWIHIKFYRTYPIRKFDTLTRSLNELNTLDMSGGQVFVSLPTFIANLAESQF